MARLWYGPSSRLALTPIRTQPLCICVHPPESVFDGVRLRTNAARRMHVRENALFLVFKLVHRLSLNWRAINAPNQLLLLLHGHRFVNGRIHLPESSKKEDIAA